MPPARLKYGIALMAIVSWPGAQNRAFSVEPQPATTQPAVDNAVSKSAPLPLPGPKYLYLRYNDDFSYLDGEPGSFTPDFFDPIKHIHVDDDWTLSLGGEIRLRMESETNRNFGTRDPTNDTFLLYREILHADLKYRKLFRVYLEGADARVADRDLPQVPGMENTFDLHQLFADVKPIGEDGPLTLRVGRQEMAYGRERLISKLDWANDTRRFDGVKLMYNSPKFDVDAFWVKPVYFMNEPYSNPWYTHINENMNRKIDHWREEQNFYGIYATYKGIKQHLWELYFIGLNDRGDFVNANTRFGDLNVYTIGSRFSGGTGNFDYDFEGAGQWGKWAGDEVHAWMFAADAGYTFKDTPMTPRVGTGFDYATGDDTPRDHSHDTFNQLYPLGHAHLGFIDDVARANIIAPNLNASFKPHKNVLVKASWYHFWLDSNLDALYNSGGNILRRNTTGSSGNDVGDELDITVNWQVDVHSSFLLGWSHLWPNNFIESSGRSQDADYVYLQYTFKF